MRPIKFGKYKKLFAVVTFSFISNMCLSQYTKDRYHIKDSLSKFNVSSYSIYEMENDGNDSLLIETLFFDKNGNLIKEFEPKYNITILYKYDSLQRLIEYHTYSRGQNETTYSFYSGDKLSKEVRKDSTGFINQTKEYFYKDSRLYSEHVKASWGSHDVNYEYDSTGLQVTESSPAYSERRKIKRNKYGGIIYFEMTDSLAKYLPSPVWFTYEKDLRTEKYHFFNDRKIVTHKMIYDKQGKILEIQYCEDYYDSPCFTRHKFHYEYFSER